MLRMRTIEQAAAEIKKADPDTAIFASIMRQKGRKVNGNVCRQVAGHDGI